MQTSKPIKNLATLADLLYEARLRYGPNISEPGLRVWIQQGLFPRGEQISGKGNRRYYPLEDALALLRSIHIATKELRRTREETKRIVWFAVKDLSKAPALCVHLETSVANLAKAFQQEMIRGK